MLGEVDPPADADWQLDDKCKRCGERRAELSGLCWECEQDVRDEQENEHREELGET
jgi:hypothetical protein